VDDVGVGRTADPRDDRVLVFGNVLRGDGFGAEHERGGAVRDRTEVVQPEGVGDDRRVEDRVEVDLLLKLRVGVVHAVFVVLHRDLSETLAGASYSSR